MKGYTIGLIALGLMLIAGFASATQLMAFHGQTNQTSGDVRIYIYDAASGGNLVYDSGTDFTGTIQPNGLVDVMLGSGSVPLNLNYGQQYWLSLSVNGNALTSSGASRKAFYSNVGNDLNVSTLRTITGTTAMTISSDGNVGIGKTAPTVKLDVNGVVKGDINLLSNAPLSKQEYIYGLQNFKSRPRVSAMEVGTSNSADYNSQLRVVFFGDSWGATITQGLQDILDAYGAAGGGSYTYNAGLSQQLGITQTFTGFTTSFPVTGIAGLDASNLSSSTVGHFANIRCLTNDVNIYYRTTVGGGDFNYYADGAYLGTQSTNAATQYQGVVSIKTLAAVPTTHDINVVVASAGTVWLNSINCDSNYPGLIMSGPSNSGATAARFVNVDRNAMVIQLRDLHPDVVIIQLGVNDSGGGPSGVAAYESNMAEIIERAREANPNVDIVINSQSAVGGRDIYPYVQAMERLAKRYSGVFVNNYAMMPDVNLGMALGYYANDTHVNTIGSSAIINNLAQGVFGVDSANKYLFVNRRLSVGAAGNSSLIYGASNYSGQPYMYGVAGQGSANIGFGIAILGASGNITTASNNVAVGMQTLKALTTGGDNIGLGNAVMDGLTTGQSNFGANNATFDNLTTGSYNVGIGNTALRNLTTANNNICIGLQCGYNLTTGASNVGIGGTALAATTTTGINTGSNNVGVGYQALGFGSTLANNTAIGYRAGYAGLSYGSSSNNNTFVGYDTSLFSDRNIQYSTAIGAGAKVDNNRTIAIGGLKPTYDANVTIGGTSTEGAKLDVNGDTKTRGDFNATGVGYVNLPAGGMWYDNETGGTLAMGVANAWFYKGDMNAGYLYQATYSDGNITLQKAGKYLINAHATLDAGNNDEIDISLLKNNVPQRNCYAARILAIGADDSSLSFTCFVTIAANDKIVLGFENSSTNNLTLHAANLTAIRIGN